jgi:hypothetical protein
MPYTAAARTGKSGALYVHTGSTTTLTKTACEQIGATSVYHVTDPAKRHLDPHTAVLVYVNDVLQTSGYHLHAAAGQIHFAVDPADTVTLSGKSYALAAKTFIKNWELSLDVGGAIEVTGMGDPDRVYISPGLVGWTASCEHLHEDDAWQTATQANGTKFILKLYEDLANTRAWVGYGVLTGAPLTVPLEGLVTETLTFQGDQEITFTTDDT